MVIYHTASVTFSFMGLLRCISLSLLDKVHATLVLFICYQRRLHTGWTVPIFEQILVLYHFFGVCVVFHEEGVMLLFLQAFLDLDVGLAHKYTAV